MAKSKNKDISRNEILKNFGKAKIEEKAGKLKFSNDIKILKKLLNHNLLKK